MISSEFEEMMRETITVQTQSSLDKYGKQAWGTGVTYKCRYMAEQRVLRDQDGREIIEQGRALVYGVAVASVKDRVTLPNGAHPLVTSVDTVYDESGTHHTVIGFG